MNGVHIGNIHQGLSDDGVTKIVNKLVESHQLESAEKDAQIKSLTETIQALVKQNASQYDVQQADLLAQGDTTKAENIFNQVAVEEERKGKESNIKAAEALRHMALAFLYDTQKALNAYKRSTELDPDNPDGWNQLKYLYRRVGKTRRCRKSLHDRSRTFLISIKLTRL
ncbi:MAG: hypothetical protein MRJ52_09565 [Nitrosomonas sp.]|nr:hypothetical protein [Nitrosomonas sp.]